MINASENHTLLGLLLADCETWQRTRLLELGLPGCWLGWTLSPKASAGHQPGHHRANWTSRMQKFCIATRDCIDWRLEHGALHWHKSCRETLLKSVPRYKRMSALIYQQIDRCSVGKHWLGLSQTELDTSWVHPCPSFWDWTKQSWCDSGDR